MSNRALAFDNIDRHDAIAGLAIGVGIAQADRFDHIGARDHAPEHPMFAVEVRRRPERDEELRAVRVAPRVGHREDAEAIVLQRKRAGLIVELITRTAPTSPRRITALSHEVFQHAVERGAVVKTITSEDASTIRRRGMIPLLHGMLYLG